MRQAIVALRLAQLDSLSVAGSRIYTTRFMDLRNRILSSRIGRVVLLPFRAKRALDYCLPPVGRALTWVATSREHTNFTYDLTSLNRLHLAETISIVTGKQAGEVESAFLELQEDHDLAERVRAGTMDGPMRWVSDRVARYGRRLGWYAMVRLLKPRIVVETGVDKGLGAVVICAALLRNSAEGSPGRYFGIDINPAAGHLLCAPYTTTGQMVYGDSLQVLSGFTPHIDLFINDSDHSAGFEYQEYKTIRAKLAEGAAILGDNCHESDSLLRFSHECGRRFLFWREQPKDHWYPGAGIGFSY